MNPITKRRLGAMALIASGIVAFVAPFLLHGPVQGTTTGPGPGPGPGPGTTQPAPQPGTSPGTGDGGSGQHKKTMKDLLDAVSACQTDNHGSQRSLLAKVYSAMKAGDSTRTDQQLTVLRHKLDTPAAQKHAGVCVNQLKEIVDELLENS